MDLKNPKYNPFLVNDYYLFEYGAVPENIRSLFKEKVLRRKGAESQKNVKLIEYYESIIDSGSFDEDEYSGLNKKLCMSRRMLDCHKARLIKQLREYYFSWEDLPGESEIDRIRRRFSCGMLREARTELIELEKKLLKQRGTAEQKMVLFEISEKLFHYYNFNRDLRRTNFYYSKAGKLSAQLI